jgi:putative YjhG/YagF family dehydratase
MSTNDIPGFADIVASVSLVASTRITGHGPSGKLPFTAEMLSQEPSGNLFGLTQNAAMGWPAEQTDSEQYLILSTCGGLKDDSGGPLALGYHTGHWELDRLVVRAAQKFREHEKLPFAGYCTDPCDGRTQGTTGMQDSLPYRNDAAIVLRRLIRSLPQRAAVMGIATCDKGLPAMLMALAGCGDLPCIVVPGGVTLPDLKGEDTASIQSIGARFAQGVVSLEYAAEMGCRVCGSPGGGCQFLGTAATAQVVSEALGLSLPHSALIPSGESLWEDAAARSALALIRLKTLQIPIRKVLTPGAIQNSMLVHAAFGGSTNLLLHLPAIAHSAGLPLPTPDDWAQVNRATPRLVDALPNGPANYPTSYVFMAGGVPEVMLHLRRMGLLGLDELTATGENLESVLDWWEQSSYREACRNRLREELGIDPSEVIMTPDRARAKDLTGTLVFPVGNIAPEGSVVKATAIDPTLVDENGVYHHRGRARVFTAERDAIKAIKGQSDRPIEAGDVLVLIGLGPSGTGMEEIYQITSALKFLPWGSQVPVLTDGRFSGVSTGPCIGHIGPEALADGPIGRLRDGDIIDIVIDRGQLEGQVQFVAKGDPAAPSESMSVLESRSPHPSLKPHSSLPEDTRLWAALQTVSGGTWAGAVYDVDRIVQALDKRRTHGPKR